MTKWSGKTVAPRIDNTAQWGRQIRSYVIGERVKDARTGIETADVEGVLNGDDLDQFLKASLSMAQPRARSQEGKE